MVRRAPVAVLVALAATLLACPGERPEVAYRAFVAAVREGDAREAWSRLSAGSQRALDARAAELARRSAGVTAARGVDLLLGDAALAARRLRSVVVVRESADAAELRVEVEGGGGSNVEMAREGGRWRVVLPSVI
jgi:hypothetical protein